LRVIYPSEVIPDPEQFEAVHRQVRINLRKFMDAHPNAPDELKVAALGIQIPGVLGDFVAQHLSRNVEERLEFLTELDLGKRMQRALEVTIRELDLLNIGNRISDEIRAKVEKHQRDFFLREQLRAIRTELGEEKDPAVLAVEELEKKLEEAGLPPDARKRADEELKRLQLVPAESPEHNVVRSYLDWIANLPWSKQTEDQNDVVAARTVLDEDHYGLFEVKDRIIEFLAVRQLNPEHVGGLMCFAGPPGVGKTSLGQSIARALGRKFYRFSVGGMRDEAEIKGHRRTYIGAMPGRVLQALKHCGTKNPVIMLDEIDKMGADWRGDPSSAMLEVLDPAQNNTFMDHYLDLAFDLSRVMFIATANVKAEIPPPLLDRLEVIDLPGYIPEEKLQIGLRHLVARQRKQHGLSTKQFRLGQSSVREIIQTYTHEAGVRELERQIGKICRKRATEIVAKKRFSPAVNPPDLANYLGPPKIHDERLTTRPKPGVAIGLAWTAFGGEVLFIEAVSMPGKGGLKVTGQLGEVMSESANIALSYVRARADALGIDKAKFTDLDLHIHFPAGAVKKDGPSAGTTITTALISLLTGAAVPAKLAMTGELTLRGEVLPVGGIREKVVAARRFGVKTVLVPARNEADVLEIPEDVRAELRFVYAKTYDDVLAEVFGPKEKPEPAAKPSARRASKKKK
jgi:ATP-dependent Lon protease